MIGSVLVGVGAEVKGRAADEDSNETPVASSVKLLGEATEPQAPAQRYVQASQASRKYLSIGKGALSEPEGQLTLRFRVENISDEPVGFDVRSAFFRSDGSVVATPYPRTDDLIGEVARGFVGLISLGASEVAMELESAEPTLTTSHELEPGQAVIVEHRLPFADPAIVGGRAFVETDSALDPAHETEVRRTLDEQYWKARDQYYAERKAENKRWDLERKELEEAKDELPALSPEYKQAMNRYWDAHRGHLARLQAIEQQFDRFREGQEQQLNSELSQGTR